MFGKTTESVGWYVYVLHRLVLMLSILDVPAETVRGCGDDLPSLKQYVYAMLAIRV